MSPRAFNIATLNTQALRTENLTKVSIARDAEKYDPQDKNIFLKIAEENMTPAKQKLSHNTETTNNTYLNTLVTKTSKVDYTIEKSNEIETDLSNNTDNINAKSENKQKIRKNNDIFFFFLS